MLSAPYLLFLGDAKDSVSAKTARGLYHWRPQDCIGQISLPGCEVDLGLPELSLSQACKQGAKTLVIGIANRGGIISPLWQETLCQAIELGLDVANGLHETLRDMPNLVLAAQKSGARLFDLRSPPAKLPIATGEKRSGKRLLTVGTDCAVGKMYTALAIWQNLEAQGHSVSFRATGQTGILIAGSGIAIDAVPADFIAGAAELLSPANAPDHWDIIEGQGSLFHPSFAGVSLGLLHGSQPDALVVCHDLARTHMRGVPDYSLPTLRTTIEKNLDCARLTNPKAKLIGISCNSSLWPEEKALDYLAQITKDYGLPCIDPVRQGVLKLIENL